MLTEWFWEGNIVASVVEYLKRDGWSIEKIANTETRETGADIQARCNGKELFVEVKGYPSKYFMQGIKKGLTKPTQPSTQARHWYGDVLFTAILRQSEHPTAKVAIALPNFKVFTNLVNRTWDALCKLDITVYLVHESGLVEIMPLLNAPVSEANNLMTPDNNGRRTLSIEEFEKKTYARSNTKLVKEVSYQEQIIRELESGTIEVERKGEMIHPVKPALRDLAIQLNISLQNSNGNDLNTRQLGSQVIKVLQVLAATEVQ